MTCILSNDFPPRSTDKTVLSAFATRSKRDPESLRGADPTLLPWSGAFSLGSITLQLSGSRTISERYYSIHLKNSVNSVIIDLESADDKTERTLNRNFSEALCSAIR